MSIVRACTPDDVPAVAGMFQRVFRHTNALPPPALLEYFDALYFHNPWYNPDISSLVHETNGRIDGFIGVYPFPLRLNDSPVQAAVGGNYMVNPDIRDPFVGVRILKTFFGGGQDIAMTDTSNETGRKMWEGMGSTTLHAYSLQWLRIIRPAGFGVSLLRRKKWALPLDLLARPFSALFDAISSGPSSSPLREKESKLHAEELTPENMLDGIRMSGPRIMLRPGYTRESLTWLLSMAKQKREFCDLSAIMLFDESHSMAGWALYYPNPGGIGQVLQLGAIPGKLDQVLAHVFEDARKKGSVALFGRADPNAFNVYSAHRCIFFHRNMYTQVNTKRQDILQALYSGGAFLTRLEGEWWTRLQGDDFSKSDPVGST